MNNELPTRYDSLGQESITDRIALLRKHITAKKLSKEYIHKIRVDIKHLRAWLRLERNKTTTPDWKEMDLSLSVYAKQLGSIRDDQAMSIMLDFLCHDTEKQNDRKAIIYVKDLLFRNFTIDKIDLDKLNNDLLTTLETFEQNFVVINSLDKFKKGLCRTIKKCAPLAEKVLMDKGGDEDLHKLRKWIKTLYYQSAYLDKTYPIDKKLKNRIHKLGDKLGKAHDLIIIKDRLASLKANKEIKIVNALLTEKISLIVENAKPDYKIIFNSSQIENIL